MKNYLSLGTADRGRNPEPTAYRRRRRQHSQEQLFASGAEEAAVKRVLNAQRQRIRRLDETYRAAERARNAQRQRRLRANDEYRASEVFRNRLRRLRKSQVSTDRKYGFTA
ncbi:hypothetical protein V5799_025751 [Amblyomma americanum]|uniref:Uncharacterized protein n=1 Tax=Amblyomma americanum TaxID=6943 RepID=A0AAQ4E8L3_AMBAM